MQSCRDRIKTIRLSNQITQMILHNRFYLSIMFEEVDIIARAALLAEDDIDVVVNLVDEIQYRKIRYTRQAEIAARVAMDLGPITDDSCSTCVNALAIVYIIKGLEHKLTTDVKGDKMGIVKWEEAAADHQEVGRYFCCSGMECCT